jgi:hypothetical protein
MVFLAVAMIGAIILITNVLFGDVSAAVATTALAVAFAWFWYRLPLLRLRE